ncbi:MAG TPA: metal ABC transporter permease [Actinomycetota bacterium]|nr:metal ABC transporter permease [Actinomycetota bacterium]
MDEFLRPFEFEFFRNGLMVATIASALCGMIGVYIVLRSMSYIGHGLSHAIFGGFAASSLMSINLFVGAGLWGLGSALLINRVTRRRSIGSDAAIGVITTASFALGLALIQLFGSPGQNPDAVLFGNVLGVSVVDVWVVVGVTIFAAAVVFTQYRPLLFSTFDPEVAGASGVKTGRIDALLMLVLALSILATMNVMGVTLIAAGIVIPAVVARLLTHSFARMLPLATVIGAFSGFVGMMASYHLNVASGPAIVLTGGLLFLIAYLATAKHRVGGRPEKHLAHI